MKDEIERLLYALKSALRYRWSALVCTWLVFIAAWIAVALIPDRFESKALVYVDTTSTLTPLLQGIAVSSNQAGEADVVRRTLLARPTLDRVARETGQYNRAKDDDQFDRLLVQLSNDIGISGNRDNGIYSIAYTDRDPSMAQAVVTHLLSTFVSSSKSADKDDSESARRFLAQQVNDYEARLTQSEQRLAEFKKKNLSLLPTSQGDYFQRLQNEMVKNTELKTELEMATRQRDELGRKIAGVSDEHVKPPPQPSAQDVTGAANLDARIQASERQLDELLQKDTDQHPDVISLRATIDQLKQRRAREFGSVRQSLASVGPGQDGAQRPDSVLQDIQIQLTNKDVQIAALQAQVSQSDQTVTSLRSLVSTGPEVEAEYTKLMRDYGVTKSEYEQLLQRLESAKISGEAHENEGVNYRIIEPPRLPVRPVAPKRSLFLGLGLIVALGCGAALAWLLSQAKPVFMDARTVREALQLPLLGVVSLAPAVGQIGHARRNRVVFFCALAALVVGTGVSIVTAHEVSSMLRGLLTMGVA